MSCSPARRAALALALFGSAAVYAQGQGLQLRSPSEERALPIIVDADRIEGVAGKDTTARGNASLRRGGLSIRADSLTYHEGNEEVEASGNVRLQRNGDTLKGPALRYSIRDATGLFEKPDFTFTPRPKTGQQPVSARGQAESIEFLGENQYRIKDGFFTSCKPGDDGWLVKADELDLDFTREVGTARGAKVYFEGLPVIAAPSFDFSLNNQRKSGFLPPSIGVTGKSGPEVGIPYYLNLAPNYDLTLTPRYMEKRGLQLAEQFRYLQKDYKGDFSAEVLPNDRAADRRRYGMSLAGSYNRDGSLLGGLNLNKVSDDSYFRDLATRINITSQATLLREGFLTYNGKWWDTGSYSATARVQRFQVLQDPDNPIVVPYGRTPQLSLSTLRQDIGGFDFGSAAEFVDFSHPSLVNGKRSTLYPSLSLPLVTPSFFLTPKVGVHYTYYSLYEIPPSATDQTIPAFPNSISRTLPIFSVDSGLIYERETNALGQGVIQTLEPRFYYVNIPFRDQNQIPLFDTAIADFNYAQIFSENMFSGGDRINDARQLTAAVTSRMLLPSTGQEVLRGTFGQRYYFKDQQVTLGPAAPRTYHASNFLTALSGRLSDSRIVEGIGGLEYGADCWTIRFVVQRFALTAGTSSSSLFLQLELNGFSRLGSNPLEALKRSIPGYQRINAPSPDRKPGDLFDFYD